MNILFLSGHYKLLDKQPHNRYDYIVAQMNEATNNFLAETWENKTRIRQKQGLFG